MPAEKLTGSLATAQGDRIKAFHNYDSPKRVNKSSYDLERTNWFGVLSGAYTFRVRIQTI